MIDGARGGLGSTTRDGDVVAEPMRERLRNAITVAIGPVASDADRQAGLDSADELAELLRVRAERRGASRRAAVAVSVRGVAGDEGRAAAFRVMAGVRV